MAINQVSIWTTYSLLGVIFVTLAFFGYAFFSHQEENKILVESIENPATTTVTNVLSVVATSSVVKELHWSEIYPDTQKMIVGGTAVEASVADSWPERIKGLSDTPFLPMEVVKLFVFDASGLHSIWMKDMLYEIDIIWVDENSKIVHLVEGASPESYPAMFTPESEAKYVIETKAGFIKANSIKAGQEVILPKL